MPRAAKPGGTGATGSRTDRPTALPATAVPSKQYGQKAEELRNQGVVPMASGDITPAGGAPPPAPAADLPVPGGLPPLDAPSNRPDEPLTHGLPSGPGGGPEVLQPPDPREQGLAVLNALGDAADPETRHVRDVLRAAVQNTTQAE
jgi:hypothetical protein